MKTLTVDEVAEVLQLHPYTVRRLSREGIEGIVKEGKCGRCGDIFN